MNYLSQSTRKNLQNISFESNMLSLNRHQNHISTFRRNMIKSCFNRSFCMNKNIFHTLKTLYNYTNKFNKELMGNFQYFTDYCLNEHTDLNVGFKSLKHAVYSLRLKIEKKELEQFFFQILCEAAALKKEIFLYENIFVFKSVKPYVDLIDTSYIEIASLPMERLADYRILINNNQINISSRAFRELPDIDAVISYDENRGFVSVDVNYKSLLAKKIQFFEKLHEILKKNGENWIVSYSNKQKSISRVHCGFLPGMEGNTKLDSSKMLDLMNNYSKLLN